MSHPSGGPGGPDALDALFNTKRQKPTVKRKKVRKSRKKGGRAVDPSRLPEMCASELLLICHEMGMQTASRMLHRDTLIEMILGTTEPPAEEVIAGIRERTDKFVRGSISILESAMPCDLNCPACPHYRVVECYSANHEVVENNQE